MTPATNAALPDAANARVQFVSHSANISGAPILLLHFARWLAEHTNLSLSFVFPTHAKLIPEFRAIGPVSLLEESGFQRESPDIVWANSAFSLKLVSHADLCGAPVVVHVHELQRALRQVSFSSITPPPVHYVCVAECVRRNLIANHGVTPEATSVRHGFVPARDLAVGCPVEVGKLNLERLGIDTKYPVVGGVGSVWAYKGADLFVEVAHRIAQIVDTPLQFVWIGGPEDTPEFRGLRRQVFERGLVGSLHLVGVIPDAARCIAGFDIFLSTSREDPFPLVCLEAASLARPIVAFDSGGVREFLLPDCGIVITGCDIRAAAIATVDLLDSGRAAALGKRAQAAAFRDVDIAVGAPRLLEILAGVISTS